jgi:hypothetical protein
MCQCVELYWRGFISYLLVFFLRVCLCVCVCVCVCVYYLKARIVLLLSLFQQEDLTASQCYFSERIVFLKISHFLTSNKNYPELLGR